MIAHAKLDSSHQAGLYLSLIPLRQGDGPLGELTAANYPQLQQFRCVPLCHVEARLLARFIPVGFGVLDGQMQPVALPYSNKRFMAGRTDALRGTIACPVLLKAFPLALGPRAEADKVAVALDQPHAPSSEIVHPIFDAEGALTPIFATKVDCLWLFAATRHATLEMSEAARSAGALVPWSVTLDFDDGEVAGATDLFTVDPRFLETADYLTLIGRFGNAFVNLMEATLLSRSHLNAYDTARAESAA